MEAERATQRLPVAVLRDVAILEHRLQHFGSPVAGAEVSVVNNGFYGEKRFLASTNAAGQAPAVHCEVCGQVLIEWGSSKVWIAQLVAKA